MTNKYSIDPTKFGMTVNQAVENLTQSIRGYSKSSKELHDAHISNMENIMCKSNIETKINSLNSKIEKMQEDIEGIQSGIEQVISNVECELENITASNCHISDLHEDLEDLKKIIINLKGNKNE